MDSNASDNATTAHRRSRSARFSPSDDSETRRFSDVEQSPLLDHDENHDDDEDLGPDAGWKRDNGELIGLPWHKRPSVYWLLFPYVISALAFGGIIVPKINLILSLICREYYADKSVVKSGLGGDLDPQCRTPEVSARVSMFTLYGGLISGILAAIIAPKMGSLSDRYGRRPIMMICNAGSLTGEIITIFAASFPETFNVHWIFLGYFMDGLTGSMMASMAVSQSYATDCTPPSRRSVIFGFFHGCLFTGIALGPLIAALIIKLTDNVIIMFYVALACHLAFIMMLAFLIPESLSKKSQIVARERHQRYLESLGPAATWQTKVRSFLNIFEPLKILYPKNDPVFTPAARSNLLRLASVDGICFGVATGAGTTFLLYSSYHFKWDTSTMSIFQSLISVARVSCLVVLLPFVMFLFRGLRSRVPNIGTDLFELSIIRLAIFFDILGFLGYIFATSGGMFIASGVVASMGGIGSPTLQAALTKHVPPDRVGQLLGAMALLHSLMRVCSPIIFNTIYAATVGKFDQMVFVLLATLFGVAWGISWTIRPGVKLNWLGNDRERRERMYDRDTVIDGAEEPLI